MLSIAAHRLHNQHISHVRFHTPAEVVAWLGAMQGQDYPGVKWSVGLRLSGSTDADIEQAIVDKAIVRTWVMRGTLHLVAGADARWMVELVAPRVIAGLAARHRQLELDEATFSHSHDVLLKALEGGQQRTRKQLFEALEKAGVSTSGQRGYHILGRASLDGLLVQGVEARKDPLFMLRDEALPNARTMPRDEALAQLARRYFLSRGPATLQDFAWWSGMTMGDARAGLEDVKDQLIEETIEGERYWLSPDTTPVKGEPAYAPPGFDEYLLGYKVRDAVLDPLHVTKVCPGKNGIFFPTMVIHGRIVGIWKRSLTKSKIVVTTAPFESVSKTDMKAFRAGVERYGEFMQMPVQMEE